jgi:hypothetical protein
VRLAQFFPNRADRVLKRLSAQGTHVLLMFKPSSYAYEQLSAPRRHARLRTLEGLEFSALPGDDQRFRPLLIQRVVQDAVDDALSTLLLDGHAAPSSGPDTDVTDIWARADEIGWTTVAGDAPAGDSVKGLSHSV